MYVAVMQSVICISSPCSYANGWYFGAGLPLILIIYLFRRYGIVAAVCATITFLAMYANGLSFHLHHYQLSLLLLPLVRFQTRFCVMCSGVLLGMFVNGVACYGFDSTWVLFDPQHPGRH